LFLIYSKVSPNSTLGNLIDIHYLPLGFEESQDTAKADIARNLLEEDMTSEFIQSKYPVKGDDYMHSIAM